MSTGTVRERARTSVSNVRASASTIQSESVRAVGRGSLVIGSFAWSGFGAA
jgi:hypothetical protein